MIMMMVQMTITIAVIVIFSRLLSKPVLNRGP